MSPGNPARCSARCGINQCSTASAGTRSALRALGGHLPGGEVVRDRAAVGIDFDAGDDGVLRAVGGAIKPGREAVDIEQLQRVAPLLPAPLPYFGSTKASPSRAVLRTIAWHRPAHE